MGGAMSDKQVEGSDESPYLPGGAPPDGEPARRAYDDTCAFGPAQRHRYGLLPCKHCEDNVRHHHVPNVGCTECGARVQVL